MTPEEFYNFLTWDIEHQNNSDHDPIAIVYPRYHDQQLYRKDLLELKAILLRHDPRDRDPERDPDVYWVELDLGRYRVRTQQQTTGRGLDEWDTYLRFEFLTGGLDL